MSNIDDDFYTEDDQQDESRPNPVRQRMRQLEKENREKDALLAKYAEMEKKMAFVEAGIPLESPMAKYFIKGYDGDLTPEAIRLAAVEAQLITPSPEATDTDRNAWRDTNNVAAGSEIAPETSWAKRISEANSEAELYAIFEEAQAQGINLSGE